MRFPLRIIGPIVAAGLVAVALTACSSSSGAGTCSQTNKRNIGVVAGSTANEPATRLSTSATAQLKAAGQTNGSVTIVVPSGKPQAMGTTLLGSTANDAIVCRSDQSNKLTQVTGYINGLKASTGEVDFLDSIDQAARGLGKNSMGVVVVGSGLQTVDPLNFAVSGLLTADPSTVVADLKSKGELPTDLSGITVYWSGLGDVAGDQQPLTITARSNLQAIWSAIIKAAGGTLSVLSETASGSAASGLPAVTAVPVPATATNTNWTQPIVVRDGDLLFVKDTATFSDSSTAQKVLAGLVPSIEQNGQVITITGTASKDQATSNTADLTLSKQRADAVKQALVALGVSASLLTTAGVGHEWCGFKTETDASGTYSDALAEQNRTVILTSPGVALCG
ncbi:OmpA family protein [Humibacter sp. RRB41]|uniref:OmpA family protein n=1 Tax=Humibacter sp. RRB41 TaxID=2919946 RepID=UPI001FA98264|nr:OmpA family protein [Humibacter sp. RRB41]